MSSQQVRQLRADEAATALPAVLLWDAGAHVLRIQPDGLLLSLSRLRLGIQARGFLP